MPCLNRKNREGIPVPDGIARKRASQEGRTDLVHGLGEAVEVVDGVVVAVDDVDGWRGRLPVA